MYSNWAYISTYPAAIPPKPLLNAGFVSTEAFPAVPGMVDMVNQAKREGYVVIVLTGRPAGQEPATLLNLTNVGYSTPTSLPGATLGGGSDGIFTKPAVASYPPYLVAACAGDPNGSCTTDHYKAATRGYIESLGYDIVANFGDQFSDFSGGFEDRTFKMPNPNYFLP